jgi:hypothetical protein
MADRDNELAVLGRHPGIVGNVLRIIAIRAEVD